MLARSPMQRSAAARGGWIVTAFGALLLLSACGTGGETTIPDARNAGYKQPVVFGRVLVADKGKALSWGSGSTDGDFYVLIARKGQSAANTYKLKEDGSFAWALAPGEYAMAGYFWRRFSRRRSDRTWTDFTVPFKSEGVYIGTLKIDAGGSSEVGISDDIGPATEALKKLAPEFKGKVAKKLMAVENLSPGVRSQRPICDKSWGVPCKNDYTGVVSLSPNTAKQTTPTVSGLQPTFRWEPASGAGVRYDIVIYEAMRYFNGRQIPGRVVDYAEGLDKPQYQPTSPLKPKTTYYWSVRLRKGDTVSNWTRYSYTAFYGIRISRRLNHLYTFDTPG